MTRSRFHDIVIKLIVTIHNIAKTLVVIGRSIGVMLYSFFLNFCLKDEDDIQLRSHGAYIYPKGIVKFYAKVTTYKRDIFEALVNCIIINTPCDHNMVGDRSLLISSRVTPFAYNQAITTLQITTLVAYSVKRLSQKPHINRFWHKGLSNKFTMEQQTTVEKGFKRVVSSVLVVDITRKGLECLKRFLGHMRKCLLKIKGKRRSGP